MPYQACGGLLQLSVGCGNPAPNMAASCLRLYSSTLCGRFRMSGRTHAPVSSAMRQERLGIESIADCACEAHVSHRPTHLSRQPLSTSASSPSQPQPAAPLHLSQPPLSTSAGSPSPPQPAAPLNLSRQPLSTSASSQVQTAPPWPLSSAYLAQFPWRRRAVLAVPAFVRAAQVDRLGHVLGVVSRQEASLS